MSSLFPGFSTDELSRLYSAESTVAALLRFEEALVLSLADAGIAPRVEAEAVAAACRSGADEPDAILASTWKTGTPILALREAVDAGDWFHYGASTQDSIDTAQMLLAKEALGLIDDRLVAIAQRLHDLTVEHRDQPQMGRTFLQDARPTTFGFRTATWLDPVLSHVTAVREQRSALTLQLGGPVGTMNQYGEAGTKVITALGERLDLAVPAIAWHTNRSRVLSLAQTLERVAVTMAKIGSDTAYLSSTPVAEVSVRFGGSSSMPEKQNPIDSVRAIAAASACTGAVGMLAGAPPSELDRAVGGWHVEWVALPLVFQTAGAAAEAVQTCLRSLVVDRNRMAGRVVDDTSELLRTSGTRIDAVLERYRRLVGD